MERINEMNYKFTFIVIIYALSGCENNSFKGQDNVKTAVKSSANSNGDQHKQSYSDATSIGDGTNGDGTNGDGTNGNGTNGDGAIAGNSTTNASTENTASLVDCTFNSLLNFGVFFNQGLFNSERTLKFPTDATKIDAYITVVHVNDNNPVILVNNQNAGLPLESTDFKAHTLIYKISISNNLKAGSNSIKGSAINAFGDEGGMQIAITGSYKAPKTCTTPTVE